uniref:Uncharacterized protein n=1 Tax=Arundo donax TaxID=35708 RepID=A0A0A8ZB20_ARUDO
MTGQCFLSSNSTIKVTLFTVFCTCFQ